MRRFEGESGLRSFLRMAKLTFGVNFGVFLLAAVRAFESTEKNRGTVTLLAVGWGLLLVLSGVRVVTLRRQIKQAALFRRHFDPAV
jgi:hypothetical protein